MKLQHLFESNEVKIGDMFCREEKVAPNGKRRERWNDSLYCKGRGVTSLEGSPKVVETFFDCDNNQITSLEGAPEKIGGYLSIQNNKLTSLQGIHKIIKEIGGNLYLSGNPIKSHMLGLLQIKNLRSIAFDHEEVERIFNKYLDVRGDIMDCQEELMAAGLEEFAKI